MPDTLERPSGGASLMPWLPVVFTIAHLSPKVDGNYGAAYFLYDYSHGFVKRGLLGALFSRHYLSRGEVRLMELFLLLLTLASTYLVCRQPLYHDRQMTSLTVLLLGGSAMLPHFAVLFFPTDPILYLAILFSLWLFLRNQMWIAWCLSLLTGTIALLVHEAFALRFYPLVIAILIELCRRRKLRWSMAAAHVAIMASAFGAIFHFGRSLADPRAFAAEAQARAGFAIDPQVFILMHLDAAGARRDSMNFMWHRGFLQLFVLSFLLAIPYLCAIGQILRKALYANASPRIQIATTWVLFCCPLLLCALTTDWFRWLSDCIICASLFILFLYYSDHEDGPVRQTLRATSQAPWVAYLIPYVASIGPFSDMWLFAANTINSGYFSRSVIVR